MKKLVCTIFVVVLLSGYAYAERIRCASTTSTQNSGLFEYLLPMVEKETGIKVDVVAVGTGAAFEIGKRGDADVLFVHAKDDELKLVKEGYFVDRHDVMYNDFVIVGPPDDPAGIRGGSSATGALTNVAKKGTPFVSRGDNSGTNKKEMAIWKTANMDPKGNAWYLEVGQGMAKTLRIANEKKAYTMTDRGTWFAVVDKEKPDLAVLVEGDSILFNQYGVMAVNPKKYPHVKFDAAKKFINFLVSEKGQKAIGSFKDSRGNQLFYPNAK
jgi:tungstate transport system substrate-binding protein